MNAELCQKPVSAEQARERLGRACVGIAGCGGLGSHAAMMLARSGVGRLILVDDDRVERSNLNRQHYFMRHLGMDKAEALAGMIRETGYEPRVDIRVVRVDAENAASLFAEADAVVEAFDSVASKSLLMRVFADEQWEGRWLVAASGLAGCGSANTIRTVRLGRRIYLCGDQQTDVSVEGVMASRVILAASHQVNMVIRLLCGEEEP